MLVEQRNQGDGSVAIAEKYLNDRIPRFLKGNNRSFYTAP